MELNELESILSAENKIIVEFIPGDKVIRIYVKAQLGKVITRMLMRQFLGLGIFSAD